ncbi:hypothetical protein [Nonomuraea recticatena]|uniref:Uncharacterized protein n=1 Tax=Nonomuraea recticatena TaxID=46178 RepID=A0ABP6FU23_9ACTN
MAEDLVRVDRQVVADGLQKWQVAAAKAQERLRDAVARIERLHAMTPWGRDASGRDFERVYMADNGPNLVIAWGCGLVEDAVRAGTMVRQSVDAVFDADAEAAARSRKAM